MKIHQPAELIQDVSVCLEMLKEGNERYLKGESIDRTHYADDRAVLATGQKPFAVIVTCSDSRVAPEVFFDQKLGDLFVIRNAGNVCDPTALGSIEYAVEHLGTSLVVICGHSCCGAVTAAVEGGDEELPPNLKSVIDRIQPAAAKSSGDVDKAIRINIEEMMAITKADAIIEHEGATVVGAYYDISSGEVIWL